jgi:polar amino acid transport system permease protein
MRGVGHAQEQAAAALGMSRYTALRHVILPQALRIAVAPTVGFGVQVIKGTALASIIGFTELSKAGTMIVNATFQPFTVYAAVALMYFALCWPLSQYSRKLEEKFHGAHRH